MYILLALVSMTNLGTYHTKIKCQDAIRGIYEQRIDPYGYMDSITIKKIVDIQLRYAAPKEFRCQTV